MATKGIKYEIEFKEKYFGSAGDVKKIIENCPKCDSKLVISHHLDSASLLLQETARCYECEFDGRKVIHVIN